MSIALVRQTLDLAEAAGYVDDFDAAQAVVDDDVATPVEAIEQVETVALVRAALGRLPARQVDVLWRYHVEGETVTEIGAALGISAARVSQLRIQAEIHMLSNVSLVNL
jgi:RNA polymerase sigma factor (sigma-70 family)